LGFFFLDVLFVVSFFFAGFSVVFRLFLFVVFLAFPLVVGFGFWGLRVFFCVGFGFFGVFLFLNSIPLRIPFSRRVASPPFMNGFFSYFCFSPFSFLFCFFPLGQALTRKLCRCQ